MNINENFYIDGEWVKPNNSSSTMDVINPATEEVVGRIALGDGTDVDRAVTAAARAFESYGETTAGERIELLEKIVATYKSRYDEIAETISSEMGAPLVLAQKAQAAMCLAHFQQAIETLTNYKFEEQRGSALIRKEPIGVVGMITPWNWPLNQIACKVAPALAAGCTMVLKPSEVAPINAILLAEILDEAGVPKGVFNLINGTGESVGEAMSSHKEIAMMSFTGSTRAGIAVAKGSADSVKRVHQELGGKSANLILEDANLEKAVTRGTRTMFVNSGQSCNAPSRMLVSASQHEDAKAFAKKVAEETIVGDPLEEGTVIGPVVSDVQYEKIQNLIKKGIEEGAELVAGGPGKPDGLETGYYVQPTVFANVSNDMTIAREEIFGPVLCILPYETEDEAIEIANDTDYGLAGYVSSENIDHALSVARKIRSGNVHINNAPDGIDSPFGGYKQSGNGREWGEFGFEEFLEIKSVSGSF
ncbi:MAG: aldehyde dehydrogenase family protein [Chloroflexi bacterium]|mgnify:CR=1 FL=1|nr:aldehyde dehydrogenase family protein [Chloroflexota bacterium]|tara:strand:- start:866 stop:2293 length:1428 start_codon:yes stop_codon:yes gene_type:complete